MIDVQGAIMCHPLHDGEPIIAHCDQGGNFVRWPMPLQQNVIQHHRQTPGLSTEPFAETIVLLRREKDRSFVQGTTHPNRAKQAGDILGA